MRHESAIIHPSAQIADDVKIGPWVYIGEDVEIGQGSTVGPHAVIKGPTKIGRDNKIYQYACIGEDTQDKKYKGEPACLEIGDRNIFREFCTMHRGTELGGMVTKIGNDNLFMAYTHVAHDCHIGNHVVFSNNASIAGHVSVGDYASLGGLVGIHQFCSIGSHSFVAAGAIVNKDILPFVTVSGNPAQVHGLNTVGLERRGFAGDTMTNLRRAYKIIFRKGLTIKNAIGELLDMVSYEDNVKMLIHFLEDSKRGIVR